MPEPFSHQISLLGDLPFLDTTTKNGAFPVVDLAASLASSVCILRAAMTFLYFINCSLITFLPLFVVYRATALYEMRNSFFQSDLLNLSLTITPHVLTPLN